jgi:hypothetical protein
MASTKSSPKQAKKSGSRKQASTASRSRRSAKGKTSASRKPTASRRRSRSKQPSTSEKLVRAVRSAKGPGIAAGAAATVIGGVAIGVRRRKSKGLGFDVNGLVKRLGKTTKTLGKTSKELGKDMQRLGDDAESVGKTLS